ncbi:pyridoxal phosphate-dependent decarboxylase family protein [Shimia abyssi]|uniref:Glutamate/tyrosine decarboxylase-like PLP-dependent enzyme n=1 Tax=Shimia abyssi TaxID=1662395 RepID=A0A2P8FJ88_9RHOB|nr:pyridoxal-dependent decarboxylase [Shimia abyssi]PSL21764.1 glutamate/tyrosine decarboxylase-like PLP-dependent enzyme [Shimia abyssi]
MNDIPEESLDPSDWSNAQSIAHKMVDDAIEHLSSVRDRTVWQDLPDGIRTHFKAAAPNDPMPLEDVYDELKRTLIPHPMGNIHPRFWGWYMGAGNFTGALGDFLAAVDGSNLGGGATSAAQIDMQVVNWFKAMMGFPDTASGTLTSGGSMANMVALTVARNTHAGVDVRAHGVAAMPQPLRFYASDQAHSCHPKSLEALGLGNTSLTLIPTDENYRMDIAALRTAIASDIAAGIKPACVIGTAGTTNTGAIDDLVTISAICNEHDMWFHVDGCIGALIRIAPDHRHMVAGIDTADSVALDPHKWLHTPFEAGCVIVRDAERHHGAFEMHGDYLQMQERGLLAGPFLADYGFELSRGFKALKIWMSIKEHGLEKFGRLIDQNIAQGQYLTARIAENPVLELIAPTEINIVCFRHRIENATESQIKDFNTELMLQIQESGIAVISDTTLRDQHCLRVAVNNHRTRTEDLDILLDAVINTGAEILAER